MSDGFPVPKPKVKQLNNVLTEEEYLQRLENIIKRDYYPELYRLDKMKKEDVTQDENMSLSQFLSTYTSDENVTLTEIIKKGDDSWYQKHSWMFQAEEHHRMKQAALQLNKLTNMVEGNRENNLQLNEYKALNPLHFRISCNNLELQICYPIWNQLKCINFILLSIGPYTFKFRSSDSQLCEFRGYNINRIIFMKKKLQIRTIIGLIFIFAGTYLVCTSK